MTQIPHVKHAISGNVVYINVEHQHCLVSCRLFSVCLILQCCNQQWLLQPATVVEPAMDVVDGIDASVEVFVSFQRMQTTTCLIEEQMITSE